MTTDAPLGSPSLNLSTGQIPVPPDLGEELRQVIYDAFRPLSFGVAVLFVLFIPFNLLDLPRGAALPVVIHDVVVLACASLLSLALRRRWLPVSWTLAVVVGLILLLASNILLAYALTGRPLYSYYIGIVLIGVGSVVMVSRWALTMAIVTILGWAPVAALYSTPQQFANLSFVLIAAILVSATVHVARVRSFVYLAQLRYRDQLRKDELEKALRFAQMAKAGLDQKVDQRTRELREANENLRVEFAGRQRLEEERLELESHLQRAQRTESIGRLAGGVAHDFNNLLTVVTGNLQLAQKMADVPPLAQEAVDEALAASERAAVVTRQLLAYSRKQVIEVRWLDLGTVVQGIRKMLERLAGEKVKLKLHINDIEGKVRGDPGQLEQVIVNLVLNARDAMPEGGTLEIGICERLQALDSRQSYAGGIPGQAYVALSVTDSGCGMDEATVGKVFEPFFTTKEQGKGTGLGLSVVQGIVTQHGGYVTIGSAPDRGTIVEVRLPMDGAEVPPVEKPVPEKQDTHGRGETILVAEDEVTVRRVAVAILEGMGYEVLPAVSGEQALEIFEHHRGEIHLLMTDLIMPGITGPALAKQLRIRNPELPVLYTSAHGDHPLVQETKSQTRSAFVVKPYSLTMLGEQIRELLYAGATKSP